MSLRIAHLVSPVSAGERDDLWAAQQVTVESMRRARQRALGVARVELLTAQFEGAPADGFAATPPLTRSVLDCGQFAVPRRLPLLADLLDRLRGSGADLVVFTNVDIVLAGDFYSRLAALVDGGLDALSITRRDVPDARPDVELDWLLAQPGVPHPGWDCFAYRAGLLDGIDFGAVCVGFPPVGALLVAALSSRTDRFAILGDERLTFHAGSDRPWRKACFEDYWQHNRREAAAALARLAARGRPSPLARRIQSEILSLARLADF